MPDPKPDKFQDDAEQPQLGLIAEFLLFLRENKKWWLLPLLLALFLLGAFVILSGTSLAPFLYTFW